MTPQALHFALHPRSVALIGASLQPQSNGVKFWNALQRSGIRHLHAVNPKYERLGEAPCYAHVKQIPGRVDLAFLAVPPKRMPAVIEELPQKASASPSSRSRTICTQATVPGTPPSRRRRARRAFASSVPILSVLRIPPKAAISAPGT